MASVSDSIITYAIPVPKQFLAQLLMFSDLKWGHSALGTPISLHASAPPAQLCSPLLLIGGVHGDEPEGVWLANKTLEMLQKEKESESVPWALIPCLNVDGIARNTRVNGRGVDLNRNFPSKSWSPDFQKDRYHPGPHPGSEPEVQLVVKLISQLRPRLVIHCHSWKPMIVCTGEPGMPEAGMLSRSSGYEVVPEIGYQTPGSLSQYGWWDHQIPIICIEEQSGAPTSEIWPRFEKGMREIFLPA